MSEQATDFAAAMNAASETAGVPTDEELYGGFLRQGDTPAEPEAPAAEQTPAEPEAEPVVAEPVAETLLAGKYKSVEDLVSAYESAQRRLGEQGNEIGQLRTELESRFTQLQSEFRQPVYQPDPGSIDSLLDENPQQVVGLAIQRQDPVLYERAMRSWYEVDPFAANQYHLQAAHQASQQAAQPDIDRAVAAANQAELSQAMATVQTRHPDFAEVVGSLTDPSVLLTTGFPKEVLQGLNGDMQSKEAVFETLYRWQKAEQAGTLREVAAQVAEETAEQNRNDKKAATVASASTTTPPEVPEDEAERLSQAFKDMDLSWRSGWTGQDSR